MKITQALIDQAAVIANAKIGDELEECYEGKWRDPNNVVLGSSAYTYRINPQPRVVYVNTHKATGSKFIHDNPESAKSAAQGHHSFYESIAVPFQQIGEGEKP